MVVQEKMIIKSEKEEEMYKLEEVKEGDLTETV
jgi:hypothetical protein